VVKQNKTIIKLKQFLQATEKLMIRLFRK